jgi:uncharacterized protein with HEPN domain
MIEFAEEIIAQTALGREAYDADRIARGAMAWNFVRLGEAANRLRRSYQDRIPTVPWAGIVGLRNAVVHRYDAVDHNVLWNVATGQIPELVAELQRLLAAFPPEGDPG